MSMKLYNEAKELFGEMVDLTDEEIKQVSEYIDSISKPSEGKTFWELIDEFVGR
ncbi:MAG: hypothetical protein IJH55_02690 [Romboutsia sp.]|nr:hypothetical protein [Romboutsia sp.]